MRFTTKAAALAAALVSSAAVAGAQTTVSGTTTGCFGEGCTSFASNANFTIDGTGEELQFAGTSFTGTTNPVTNAFTVGNFGSLTLAPPPSGMTPNTTFSTPFSLMFNLTSPAGASSPATTFIVSGFVGNTNGMGTRDISYSGGTAFFTAPGGSGSISVDRGFIGIAPTNVSGRVTASVATVPEPSTYALMGMGLVGTLAAARRRRSA